MVRPIEVKNLGPAASAERRPRALAGVRVLIVEDDYYLAMEAKSVLEEEGATVIGPFSTFRQVQQALADQAPECAIVDINLGEGPSFAAAQRLAAEGVPFLFLTGYDRESVPDEFQHIPRTVKPARPEVLIAAVRALTA